MTISRWWILFPFILTMFCGGGSKEQGGKKVEYVTKEDKANFPEFVNSLPFYELRMKKELVGKHPRLFFSREDIPVIRQKGKTTNLWFKEKIKKDHGRYFDLPIPTTMMDMQSQSEGMFAWGWWRLMGLNMIYLVDEDAESRDRAHKWVMEFCRYKSWRRGTSSDLSDSDLMSGVAATYDILYDVFTPVERDTIRRVLLKNLEFLYSAFMTKTHDLYWQRDFQNNHHWNRIHGLLITSAAICGDDPKYDSKHYLDYAYSQCRELLRWLPEDGTCHEGPGYWSYGHKWIIRLFDCLQHLTGENYLGEHPYFKNAMYFKIQLTSSNLRNSLYFGDGGPGVGTGLYVFYRLAAECNDGHFQYFAERIRREIDPEALFEQAWGTLWYNADIKPQPLSDLPLSVFFPDLDLLVARSGWDDDAAVFGIKCGPPGGYLMNELRFQKEGPDKWVNVAHDHPDQNHFIFYAQGEYWADDDGYPKRSKSTSSHNTLLVDGKGQPNDNMGWYQPFEMERTGFCRDVWHAGSNAIFVGDASRCYDSVDTYHRYAAFINGEYLVLLDEIAGKGRHDYELRFHRDGKWKQEGAGRFRVTGRKGWAGIRVLGPAAIGSEFVPAIPENEAKPCLALRVKQQEKARVVSLLVPSNADVSKLAKATLEQGPDMVRVTVPGKVTEELLVVRLGRQEGPYDKGGIKGDFSSLLTVKERATGQWKVLMAMNCSQLEIDGTTYLASPTKVNYCRRSGPDGTLVDLSHPFKKPGAPADLTLGGFKPNQAYTGTESRQQEITITSTETGAVKLPVALKDRASYCFK